ncbi:MAG TPA: DUF4190 domain-containing protein [Kofleriaceae bacterium]|nr:DUF4190 domain-containing protein [Kofleriaceae bacterium]
MDPSMPQPQPNYGFTQGEPQMQMPPQQQGGNGLAIAGMVLGIIGLVLFWVPFLSWVLALLAIVFGAIGMNKAKRVMRGKGMAMTGLILGIITMIAGVAFFVWALEQAKKARSYRYNEYGMVMPGEHAPAPTPDRLV